MSVVFQLGGALRPGALYLTRAADEEAFAALLAGDAIAVLAPRQHGKSSLRLRLAARLYERGIPTVHLDLTGYGVPRDPQRWMASVVEGVEEEAIAGCGRQVPPREPTGDPAARLRRLIEHLNTQGPWALLVDELDSLISSPGAADLLLGGLRAAWEHQARDGAPRGLRLGLFGVLAPFELGLDPHRTPFNITRSILLDDFTASELAPLAARLPERHRELWISEIMAWTAGQPYLTQRLAERVAAEHQEEEAPAAQVAALVERLFLRGGAHHDPNLAGVARQVGAAGTDLAELLSLYRAAIRPEGVEADGRQAATTRLLLTGLVTWRAAPGGPRLFVRNRLYATVFDDAWAQAQLERRPFAAAFEAWRLGGQTADGLLRGEALLSAETWARARVDLSQDEMGFLLRSAEAWRDEEGLRLELEQRRLGTALAEEQRRRERQRARSLAFGLVLATVAIVLLVGLRSERRLRTEAATFARTASSMRHAQVADQWLRLPDLARAELYAAASLANLETPAARGVLMQAGAIPHLTPRWSQSLAFGATTFQVQAGGDRLIAPYATELALIDSTSGELLKRLEGLGAQGRGISPDGARVLGQRSSDQALVWVDAATGDTLWEGPPPTGPNAELDNALLEPGGEVAILILHKGPVLRWRISDQTVLWSAPNLHGARCMPALNPTLGLLALGCTDGQLEVRRIETGALVFETLGRPLGGYALTWAGDTLLFGGRRAAGDGLLYAWREGMRSPEVALSTPAVSVWGSSGAPQVTPLQLVSLAASDERTVWAGLDDGSVAGIFLPTRTLFTRTYLGKGPTWVSTSHGQLFTLTTISSTLRAWTPPTAPTGLQPVSGGLSLSAVAVSPEALAVATSATLVELRDPRSGALLGALHTPHDEELRRLTWARDTLWAGTARGSVLRAEGERFEPVLTRPVEPDSAVSGLTSDPAGQHVAVKRSNGPLTVLHTDGASWSLPCASSRDAVALSDDGRWLAATCQASAEGGETLKLWSLGDEGPVEHTSAPLDGAYGVSLAWAGDTLLIAVETPNGRIQAWRPAEGLRDWPGRGEGMVTDLAVSPDGALVATTDVSGLVRVWTSSGELLASLGPVSPMALRVHLDETHLTARLTDGKVARWPLHTLRRPALTLYDERSAAWSLTLLNDALVSTFDAGDEPCPLTGPQHAGVTLTFDEGGEDGGWFIVEGEGPELRTRGELRLKGVTYTVHEASTPPWASLNGDFGWELVGIDKDDRALTLRVNSSCEPDDVKRGHIMARYSLSGALQGGTTTDGYRVRVSPWEE